MRFSGLPSLRALQVFEAAARHENFSQAAEELAVTQSAVSRQVLQLESEVGNTLFDRRGPKLRLTDAGRAYAEVAREGLAVLRRGTARLFADERTPNLTITTIPSFASRWLLPRLSGFEKKHPDISVRIAVSSDLVDFDSEPDIDVGIRSGRGDWPRVFSKPLLEELLFPVCSPSLAMRIKAPADLHDHRLLFEDQRLDQWRHWASQVGVEFNLKPKDRLSDDFNIQLQAAMLGQGVALGRSLLVADDLRAGRLVCPIRMPVFSTVRYFIVCPKERTAEPSIDALVNWLLAAAKESVVGLDRYIRD